MIAMRYVDMRPPSLKEIELRGASRRQHWRCKRSFEGEQRPFDRQSSGVADQRAIAANDAVTRHDNRQGIPAVGQADGADRVWVADAAS